VTERIGQLLHQSIMSPRLPANRLRGDGGPAQRAEREGSTVGAECQISSLTCESHNQKESLDYAHISESIERGGR
jgi:hypothetical protein